MHLHLSTRRDELDYLLNKVTLLLDLSDSRLQQAFYPSSLHLQDLADIKAMATLRRVSRSMPVCNRIYEAGNACGDMGWALIGVGRKEEGERWCEFDGQLNEIAWQVEQEERAKAARIAAEEEREKRARVQTFVHMYGREVVEID